MWSDIPLTDLHLWIDDIKRPGPENMAVDEWLLETIDAPILRVYGWLGSWGSLGCFGSLKEAESVVQSVSFVRRLTGGGVVDHQNDWTYTLVIPAKEKLAGIRGPESYRLIHQALASSLENRLKPTFSDGSDSTGSDVCFDNPVCFDLLFESKRKLAGAGQRRSKHGLLHQGSVALKMSENDSIDCSNRFAAYVAESWSMRNFWPDAEDIAMRVDSRYGNPEWTCRR